MTHASPSNYRRTALIVACALFMQNLDATVLATALPTMTQEFAVSPSGISLALTGYLLALAIFVPASGPVADRFGARRTFQCAIVVFLLGSIACGLSQGITMLVASRFVQGMGGAMMLPVGRLVLLRSVAKHEMVTAMAWLTMPAMIGPIVGPTVGGAIVTWLDWRWIFWINLPIGSLGVFLVGRYIRDSHVAVSSRFDFAGFFLCAMTLGPLIFGLELVGRSRQWIMVGALLATGCSCALLYIRHARRMTDPMLDLNLLHIPTFRLSMLGGGLIRLTQGAMPFLIPMLLQLSFGFDASTSGIISSAMAIGALVMKGAARSLLRRFGFRATLTVVGLLIPMGYACVGLTDQQWPIPAIYLLLMICGFLSSLQFTAYNAIAYADVNSAQMSRATSFYATVQQLSLSLGICVGASALSLTMRVSNHLEPTSRDFAAAIWSVTAISLLAVFANRALAPDAGIDLSGHSAARK